MRTRILLALAVGLSCVSCATLTPQEESGVFMTRNSEYVKECTWLGSVETSWQANKKRAEIDLMKKTFAKGGNVVLVIPQPPTFTIHMTGDAYKCPVEKLPKKR